MVFSGDYREVEIPDFLLRPLFDEKRNRVISLFAALGLAWPVTLLFTALFHLLGFSGSGVLFVITYGLMTWGGYKIGFQHWKKVYDTLEYRFYHDRLVFQGSKEVREIFYRDIHVTNLFIQGETGQIDIAYHRKGAKNNRDNRVKLRGIDDPERSYSWIMGMIDQITQEGKNVVL